MTPEISKIILASYNYVVLLIDDLNVSLIVMWVYKNYKGHSSSLVHIYVANLRPPVY